MDADGGSAQARSRFRGVSRLAVRRYRWKGGEGEGAQSVGAGEHPAVRRAGDPRDGGAGQAVRVRCSRGTLAAVARWDAPGVLCVVLAHCECGDVVTEAQVAAAVKLCDQLTAELARLTGGRDLCWFEQRGSARFTATPRHAGDWPPLGPVLPISSPRVAPHAHDGDHSPRLPAMPPCKLTPTRIRASAT